jgi:hypothetical protein
LLGLGLSIEDSGGRDIVQERLTDWGCRNPQRIGYLLEVHRIRPKVTFS